MSDWDLLERARRGHDGAWTELVSAHAARLRAMAMLITGSRTAAEDILQESFVRLLSTTIRHQDGTVGGWLGTTVWRLSLGERERTQKLHAIESFDFQDEATSPIVGLIRDENLRSVAAAIAQLPVEQRDCLVLRFYGEHSYAEIADLTNVPIGTVKSRIFHAVKNCREKLRMEGVLEACI